MESWTNFPFPGEIGQYPVEKLNQQDLQIIESFLLRRKQLTNRSELARQIYLTMCNHMGIMADPVLNLDQMEGHLVGMLKAKNTNSKQ